MQAPLQGVREDLLQQLLQPEGAAGVFEVWDGESERDVQGHHK